MIHEVLMYRAHWAIKNWSSAFAGPLVLTFRNGRIGTSSLGSCPTIPDPALIVSVAEQKSGLSGKRWTQVYNALLNLYEKDKSCQTRQKR